MFARDRAAALLLPAAILAGCAGTGEQAPTTRLPADLAQALPGGAAPARAPAPPSEREIRAMVTRLIPVTARARRGWADDLHDAFSRFDLPHAPQVYCAAIAIIEQESSF
jgi:hypothetical protein